MRFRYTIATVLGVVAGLLAASGVLGLRLIWQVRHNLLKPGGLTRAEIRPLGYAAVSAVFLGVAACRLWSGLRECRAAHGSGLRGAVDASAPPQV